MGLKWRPDPALDVFRSGLAALSLEGRVVAYLATIVERVWWRQERVWLLVTHLDGTHERIMEDYEPWTSVAEVRAGHLVWDLADGEVDYQVTWLDGGEREPLWGVYGIVNDAVGNYL